MSNDNPYGNPTDPQQPYAQQQFTEPGLAWLASAGYGGAPGARTLASAGDRFLARVIDAGVLLIPVLLLVFTTGGSFLYTVLVVALVFGYEIAMLLTQNQQTVGKKVMKLRVVSLADGGRPADSALWTRAGVYGLPRIVPYVGTLFSILNAAWLLWDSPFKQCLHDKAAKTVVVKEH